MSEHIVNIDEQNAARLLIEESYQRPVVVDFWADWCAPCHALAPHLERVVGELEGQILLAKVEVDEGDNMKLAGHYRVRGFPTLILFQGGEERGRFHGAKNHRFIGEFIQQHADLSAPSP